MLQRIACQRLRENPFPADSVLGVRQGRRLSLSDFGWLSRVSAQHVAAPATTHQRNHFHDRGCSAFTSARSVKWLPPRRMVETIVSIDDDATVFARSAARNSSRSASRSPALVAAVGYARFSGSFRLGTTKLAVEWLGRCDVDVTDSACCSIQNCLGIAVGPLNWWGAVTRRFTTHH